MEEEARRTEEVIYQICRVCKQSKHLSEFYKKKGNKLGRSKICKECQANYDKKRHELNHNRRMLQSKQWQHDHKPQISEYGKNYYLVHKPRIREKRKIYRRAHKAQIAKREKIYNQTQRGHFVQIRKNHLRRARERASKSDLTSEQWARIVKVQKFRCNMCGKKFSKSRAATVDHIIPISKGGAHTSSNIQALCQSCNSSKQARILNCFITSWIYK